MAISDPVPQGLCGTFCAFWSFLAAILADRPGKRGKLAVAVEIIRPSHAQEVYIC